MYLMKWIVARLVSFMRLFLVSHMLDPFKGPPHPAEEYHGRILQKHFVIALRIGMSSGSFDGAANVVSVTDMLAGAAPIKPRNCPRILVPISRRDWRRMTSMLSPFVSGLKGQSYALSPRMRYSWVRFVKARGSMLRTSAEWTR